MFPDYLVIRGKKIGIVGLNAAFSTVLSNSEPVENMSVKELARKIFNLIETKNYIPSGYKDDYILAISDALNGLVNKDAREKYVDNRQKILEIKIFGKDCMTCSNLEQTVRDVLEQFKIACDINVITDYDEIWRHGVFSVPAIMINGRLMSSGRLPSRAMIEKWISEHLTP